MCIAIIHGDWRTGVYMSVCEVNDVIDDSHVLLVVYTVASSLLCTKRADRRISSVRTFRSPPPNSI